MPESANISVGLIPALTIWRGLIFGIADFRYLVIEQLQLLYSFSTQKESLHHNWRSLPVYLKSNN